MKIKRLLITLCLSLLTFIVSSKEVYYNIIEYGAKGDGKTNCTVAINSAIEHPIMVVEQFSSLQANIFRLPFA